MKKAVNDSNKTPLSLYPVLAGKPLLSKSQLPEITHPMHKQAGSQGTLVLSPFA